MTVCQKHDLKKEVLPMVPHHRKLSAKATVGDYGVLSLVRI